MKIDKKTADMLANAEKREMDYLFRVCGLPPYMLEHTKLTPENVDVAEFKRLKKIFDGIDRFVREGRNLYIYSNRFGNGKTTWAKNMLVEYIKRVALGNQFRNRAMFVSVSDFLLSAKQQISMDNDFDALFERVQNADLVVWDDISTNKLSEYEHKLLFPLIDQRTRAGKSNIYTSNLNGDGLVKVVGQRLTSRVWNGSQVVELKGTDRRGEHDTIADFE